MAERLESLKAGIIAALSLFVAGIITNLVNSLVLARYFVVLDSLRVNTVNWQLVASGAIAAICGLLFGVTYRYIIREDNNPQLKAGAVLAFGLVRGLSQLDLKLYIPGSILPVVILAIESIVWFAVAAIALDWTIQLGWVKPFN